MISYNYLYFDILKKKSGSHFLLSFMEGLLLTTSDRWVL